MVALPARVLELRRYRSARGTTRTIVVVEARKRLRERSLSEVQRLLGRSAQTLGKLRGARKLGDAVPVYRVGQLWPGA
jgi:hypothetical protein